MKQLILLEVFLFVLGFSSISFADREYSCDTCLNGGKCLAVDEVDTFSRCICTSNPKNTTFYTGDRCETPALTCISSTNFTCYNGGQCSATNCSCPLSWKGNYCETSTQSSKTEKEKDSNSKDNHKPKWYLVLVGVVATAILGILFLAIVISIFKSRRKPKFVDIEKSLQMN